MVVARGETELEGMSGVYSKATKPTLVRGLLKCHAMELFNLPRLQFLALAQSIDRGEDASVMEILFRTCYYSDSQPQSYTL